MFKKPKLAPVTENSEPVPEGPKEIPPVRLEYKLIHYHVSNVEATFADMGQAGWEFIGCETTGMAVFCRKM